MASTDDFDEIVEPYHQALGEIINGNPQGYRNFYSHKQDVTLANPFGPPAHGWDEVAKTLEGAASHYREGELTSFETVAKYVTAELAYLVEMERFKAKVGAREECTPVTLRVTSIFRPEGGTWKLVHRHADPISTPQPAQSVIQQ
jgi:ketosteroid isomerase-like protein